MNVEPPNEEASNAPSQRIIEEAMFNAPWKTPSQYAAYINTIRDSLAVKAVREVKHLERIRLLTPKGITDHARAAAREAHRATLLRKQAHVKRHYVSAMEANAVHNNKQVKRAVTPQMQPSRHLLQLTRACTSMEEQAPSTVVALPELRSAADADVNNEGDDSTTNRLKVGKDSHNYVFDDEVGLIDIDEGSSSDSVSLDDDEALERDHVEERIPSSELPTQPSTNQELDDQLLLHIMFHADEELLSDMVPLGIRDTDELEVHNGGMQLQPYDARTQEPNPALKVPKEGGSHKASKRQGSHVKSIAVYMSSLRPNGILAVVRIEQERRQRLISSWQESYAELVGTFNRLVSSKRTKEQATKRFTGVVVEQEAALRISMTARTVAHFERLKSEEVLARRKLERVAKFRGRLNEKEESTAKEDLKQKQVLDRLAHEMLERVMNDGKADVDIMVDNTDPWEANRRRSSAARRMSTVLKESAVLHRFYDQQLKQDKDPLQQRRRSSALGPQQQVSPMESSLMRPTGQTLFLTAATTSGAFSPGGSDVMGYGEASPAVSPVTPPAPGLRKSRAVSILDHHQPSLEASTRREQSVWCPTPASEALPSAMRGRIKSIAISYASTANDEDYTPEEGPFPNQNVSPQTSPDQQPSSSSKSQATIAREERWRHDAETLANHLKVELLTKRKPDFDSTYRAKKEERDVMQRKQTPLPPAVPVVARQQGHQSSAMLQQFTAFGGGGAMPHDPPRTHLGGRSPQPSSVLSACEYLSMGDDGSATDSAVLEDNPIAAALASRQQKQQRQNDERLASYQALTTKYNLNHAVEQIVRGDVRRATVFRKAAGIKLAPQLPRTASHEANNMPSTPPAYNPARVIVAKAKLDDTNNDALLMNDDSAEEYAIQREPTHTNFNSTLDGMKSLASTVDQLISTPSFGAAGTTTVKNVDTNAAVQRKQNQRHLPEAIVTSTSMDNNDERKTSGWSILRRSSLARLQEIEHLDLGCASFGAFHHDGDDDDEALASPSKTPAVPSLRRRHSSFFHLLRKPSDAAPEDLHLSPPSAGGSSLRSHPHSPKSSSLVLQAGQHHRSRKRSNVAALLLNSGLGRHDLSDTKKTANGDTLLYKKQRARMGSHLSVSSVGSVKDPLGNSTVSSHDGRSSIHLQQDTKSPNAPSFVAEEPLFDVESGSVAQALWPSPGLMVMEPETTTTPDGEKGDDGNRVTSRGGVQFVMDGGDTPRPLSPSEGLPHSNSYEMHESGRSGDGRTLGTEFLEKALSRSTSNKMKPTPSSPCRRASMVLGRASSRVQSSPHSVALSKNSEPSDEWCLDDEDF